MARVVINFSSVLEKLDTNIIEGSRYGVLRESQVLAVSDTSVLCFLFTREGMLSWRALRRGSTYRTTFNSAKESSSFGLLVSEGAWKENL